VRAAAPIRVRSNGPSPTSIPTTTAPRTTKNGQPSKAMAARPIAASATSPGNELSRLARAMPEIERSRSWTSMLRPGPQLPTGS
jgi:hypothetical protein